MKKQLLLALLAFAMLIGNSGCGKEKKYEEVHISDLKLGVEYSEDNLKECRVFIENNITYYSHNHDPEIECPQGLDKYTSFKLNFDTKTNEATINTDTLAPTSIFKQNHKSNVFIFDLDGTIFDRSMNTAIDPSIATKIIHILENGGTAVLSSGRYLSKLDVLNFNRIKDHVYIIDCLRYLNSIIKDKTLFRNLYISSEFGSNLHSAVYIFREEYDLDLWWVGRNTIPMVIQEEMKRHFFELSGILNFNVECRLSFSKTRFSIVFDDSTVREYLLEEIEYFVDKYGLDVNISYKNNSIEILSKKCNKVNVVNYFNNLGYNTIVFGNDVTDDLAIKNATVGVKVNEIKMTREVLNNMLFLNKLGGMA